MNRTTTGKQRKVRSIEVAKGWLELGIQPVPLKYNSKRPAGGKGWNQLKVSPRTIPQFFVNGDNVGGLWGEPSNWIVDIDLDWDEAALFASYYLPDTFTYGRQTRPSTHYLYHCPGVTTASWSIRGGKNRVVKIAEIRSTGSQSVLPPSIHPDDKDRYEINRDLPFTTVGKAQLERFVSHIAAAAILIREFPEHGGRHDYIHSLTGALMWSGWEENDVSRFMKALLECIDDEEIRDRRTTVDNTLEHFKKGDRIAGWRTLSQWIKPSYLQALRKWLTPDKKFQIAPKLIDGEIIITIPRFDPLLGEVPGLVGEITRWASQRCYLKQPAFDLAVGLMCTALISCNKYVVQGWTTPLQPYFILLAPTAGGKGSALDSVYQFASKVRLGDYVFQGFQSYYALLDKLSEPPGLACWLWDEAARRIKSTKNPGSFDYQIITWILGLYGRANSNVPAFPGRKTEIPSLERPWLALFAAAQPTQLIEAVGVSDLAAGLINRFLLFDSGDLPPDANFSREEIFPSSILAKSKAIREYEPRKNPKEIHFESTEVWAMFRDFDEESRRMAAVEGDNEVWGRANQNALLSAGTVAVGINHTKPVISAPVAKWAIALVRWGIACWTARIGDSTSRNYREKESKEVERYIREAKKYLNRATGKANRELIRRGLMPNPVLQKLCRHLTSKEFSDIIDQLVEARLIGCGEENGVECYWPTK